MKKNMPFQLKNILVITSIITILFTSSCNNSGPGCLEYSEIRQESIKIPALEFNPESYICYRAEGINIDGLLDEDSWKDTDWTNDFVDIEGDLKPAPLHRTRAKMLWDEDYLYIAAELTEPHIWAKLRQRDTVIFYDNDFEVFIDPDGDTHEYMEFEMNAFNTIWDLLLTKPYRDHGRVADAWNINGIKTAVKIYGTLNDPSDRDEKWVVELAFPFDVLTEFGDFPKDKSRWRINFSRVNWRTVIENGKYIKEINPETGRVFPEYNWVWSPQGLINMHYPETWGYLQFSEIKAGEGSADLVPSADEQLKWILRTLYYAQRKFAEENSKYTDDINELKKYGYLNNDYKPCILIKPLGYECYLMSDKSGKTWILDDSGRIYSRNN